MSVTFGSFGECLGNGLGVEGGGVSHAVLRVSAQIVGSFCANRMLLLTGNTVISVLAMA